MEKKAKLSQNDKKIVIFFTHKFNLYHLFSYVIFFSPFYNIAKENDNIKRKSFVKTLSQKSMISKVSIQKSIFFALRGIIQ